uniref:Putative secreted mucin n=1 Tax=Amblyomma triste TaxID=251400 RepID=A0A023G5A8_AMBTT
MFSSTPSPAVASAPPATSHLSSKRAPRWMWLLLFLCASVTISTAYGVTPPTDYERSQNLAADTGGASIPEASWRGYPRLFTERTSSLLSEAVQMLHRAKDVQERRWLQAFVQRLTQLAVDLERSTLFLRSSPPPSPGHESFQQEQTVPTTGQISPPPSPSSSGKGARTTTQESVQDEVRGLGDLTQ